MSKRLPDPDSYDILGGELVIYLSELVRSIEDSVSEVAERQDTRSVLPSYSIIEVDTAFSVGKEAIVLVDASASAVTVTLPNPAEYYRNTFTIKKIDDPGNEVYIEVFASGIVNGSTQAVLQGPGRPFMTVISDGKQYWTI